MASGSTSRPNCRERRRMSGSRFAAVEEAEPLHRFEAEHYVLSDGEDRDEHEVLVHHADAAPHRLPGIGEANGLAVDTDLARVGMQQPEQDIHERGLPGAVLAEKAVDLALLQGEVHAIVGHQRPERLGNPSSVEPHGSSYVSYLARPLAR